MMRSASTNGLREIKPKLNTSRTPSLMLPASAVSTPNNIQGSKLNRNEMMRRLRLYTWLRFARTPTTRSAPDSSVANIFVRFDAGHCPSDAVR